MHVQCVYTTTRYLFTPAKIPPMWSLLMHTCNITYLGRATALKCWSALEYNFFLPLRYSVYSNQAATAIPFSLLAMWALARRVFGPSFISSQCSQRRSHTTQQWWTLCIRGEKSLDHFFLLHVIAQVQMYIAPKPIINKLCLNSYSCMCMASWTSLCVLPWYTKKFVEEIFRQSHNRIFCTVGPEIVVEFNLSLYNVIIIMWIIWQS